MLKNCLLFWQQLLWLFPSVCELIYCLSPRRTLVGHHQSWEVDSPWDSTQHFSLQHSSGNTMEIMLKCLEEKSRGSMTHSIYPIGPILFYFLNRSPTMSIALYILLTVVAQELYFISQPGGGGRGGIKEEKSKSTLLHCLLGIFFH